MVKVSSMKRITIANASPSLVVPFTLDGPVGGGGALESSHDIRYVAQVQAAYVWYQCTQARICLKNFLHLRVLKEEAP